MAGRFWIFLQRAREVLCAKYEVQLTDVIHVEIFPRQQDFAVRTFGMPGGDGFLGVCFGNVVTANSPASQGENPANWQSVLWHEFCHVVTLRKTSNKMPRWLSEGISVYEERQADSRWGQSMNPRYREMIVGGQLTPVSQLSAAFLQPPSPLHLDFAYFESSLVVEYIVARHGLEVLKRILSDLGDGLSIETALGRNVGSPVNLDAEFEKYAREQAEGLALVSTGSSLGWSATRRRAIGPGGTRRIPTATGGCWGRPVSSSRNGSGMRPACRWNGWSGSIPETLRTTAPTRCWHTSNANAAIPKPNGPHGRNWHAARATRAGPICA